MPVHVSIYLYLISVFIILLPSWGSTMDPGRGQKISRAETLLGCGTFSDHLVHTKPFGLLERFGRKQGTKHSHFPWYQSGKSDHPCGTVPDPHCGAGRCGSARGASGDPGPLSCKTTGPEKGPLRPDDHSAQTPGQKSPTGGLLSAWGRSATQPLKPPYRATLGRTAGNGSSISHSVYIVGRLGVCSIIWPDKCLRNSLH